MTETEALRCLTTLTTFDRYPWTAQQLEAWKEAIAGFVDADAGLRASKALVREHAPKDWSLHLWRELYRAEIAPAAPAAPMPEEHAISLGEHIARLEARAADGDQAAAAELRNWRRYRAGRILRSVS